MSIVNRQCALIAKLYNILKNILGAHKIIFLSILCIPVRVIKFISLKIREFYLQKRSSQDNQHEHSSLIKIQYIHV